MLRVLNCIVAQPAFMAPKKDMSGKTVVVTGPTIGGIGYNTASTLASFGARVVLAARNQTTAAAAAAQIRDDVPSACVPLAECDLSRLETVSAFARSLGALAPDGVDVLVCNAGAMLHDFQRTSDGVEMSFAVAALGHHLLVHLVRPRRVVWVSGDIYVLSQGLPDPFLKTAGLKAYSQACHARLLLAGEWKRRAAAAGAPMEVVAVHPGVINSDFAKLPRLGKVIAGLFLLDVEHGAQASVLAATAASADICQDRPLPYYHNKQGWYELEITDIAMNEAAARRLFDQCDQLCHIER